MKRNQLLTLVCLQILELSKSLRRSSENKTLQIDKVNISLELENNDIKLLKKVNKEVKGVELIFKNNTAIFNVKIGVYESI